MYRVMVVEDSKPIVRDIIHKIQSVNSEITAIEIAYDGDSAINRLKTLKPDILFTDIKLPFMDGLTLIQKAKSLYPSLKCVIISGYDDFEFTRKALKLHVEDYLLKPVDFEEFKKITTRLIGEVNSIALMKQEEMISNILNKTSKKTDNVDLPKDYAVSVIRNGFTPQFSGMLTRNEIYESLGMTATDGGLWVLDTKFNFEKVIFYDLERHSEEKIKEQNETIFRILNNNHSQLNIMCSEKLSDIEQLDLQYTMLSNSLNNMVLLNRPGIYFASFSSRNYSFTKINNELAIFRKKMESFVRNKISGDFHAELSRNIRAWEQNNYPVNFLRRFLLILLDEISSSLENDDQLLLENPYSQVDRILSNCNSFRDLEVKLFEYYDLFINAKNQKPGTSFQLARKIEEYLRKNIYGNLTMQSISDEFKLSQSYISRLMKMYYNNSPMDYYNKIKIEEAKKLITENHDMLIKDIAEILGFNDQHYFSKVFKIQFGLSPVDFKKAVPI